MFETARKARLLAAWAAASLSLGACASAPDPIQHEALGAKLYTRYCMHGHQENSVKVFHRSNYLIYSDVFPPGSEVVIRLYSPTEIRMTINGIPCVMYPDGEPFPTASDQIDRFLSMHFAKSAEDTALGPMDDKLRGKLLRGEAPLGATKKETLVALGFPCCIGADDQPVTELDIDRILQSNQWKYHFQKSWVGTYWRTYQFSDGKLVNILR